MLIETFSSAEYFSYPCPDLCPCLKGPQTITVLGLYGLVCTLTCTVSYGTLDWCVAFQIMSSQLNLPQLDSSQGLEISD